MRRSPIFSLLALAAIAPAALAQSDDQQWLEQCRRGRGDRDRESHCEIREFRLGARRDLVVDAGVNGGVSVRGTDRSDILVRARIHAQAMDEATARSIAGEISIDTAGGRIDTDGPRSQRRESWGVSYVIEVPRRLNLDLSATNGGLSVANVEGRVELETVNGGIAVVDGAGELRGRTSNGGISLKLDGSQWQGAGVDLRTTNGGVTIAVPENYSARLEAGTTNGGFNIEFPITMTGRISRHISADLGRGGPPIRVITTNGGVHLTRR